LTCGASTSSSGAIVARKSVAPFRAKVDSLPPPGGELLRQMLAGPVSPYHWGRRGI